MGLATFYRNRAVVPPREPTRAELAEQLEAEKARASALEAQLAQARGQLAQAKAQVNALEAAKQPPAEPPPPEPAPAPPAPRARRR